MPLPDASFDVVFCDHGAMTFADPYAHRPRGGAAAAAGRAVRVLASTRPFVQLCWSGATATSCDPLLQQRLLRHAPPRRQDGSVAFQLPYGDWIRLFRATRLVEARRAALAAERVDVGAGGARRAMAVGVDRKRAAMTGAGPRRVAAWSRSGRCARRCSSRERARRPATTARPVEDVLSRSSTPSRAASAAGRGRRVRQRRATGAGVSLGVGSVEARCAPTWPARTCVELGCGTAYVSAWLARRGARPVGVDVTPAQLDTARAMQARARARVPARRGERRGRAAARRVVRPRASPSTAPRSGPTRTSGSPRRRGCCGPAASSCSSSTARSRCSAAQDEEVPPTADLRRVRTSACTASSGPRTTRSSSTSATATGSGSCGENGFEVLDLIEIQAPEGARRAPHDALPRPTWARRWPSEEIWRARKIA